MVAVVVREQHEHRLRVLALDVLRERFLAGVFSGLRYVEARPAGVAPEPGVGVSHLLVVRRCQLRDAAAEPAHRDTAARKAGVAAGTGGERAAAAQGASAERERAAETEQAVQDLAPAEIFRFVHWSPPPLVGNATIRRSTRPAMSFC